MKPVSVIQVGMGGWGRNWARLMASIPEVVEIVAYVDVVPSMLAQLQEEAAVPESRCFASLADALAAEPAADGILVTTPLGGHIPVVLEALDAGKHVLVEKPFAPSIEEGQSAVDRAKALDRILMVSQNYRFYPAPLAVAALLRSGELGVVGSATVQFRKYANSAAPATNNHFHIRQPLLMDMSIHHWDLMRYVLGQNPTEVYCHAWNPAWSKFDEPAEAVATIAFAGGAVVDYHGSWVSTAAPTTWGGDWHIECERGEIHWTSRNDSTTADDAVTVRPRGKRARRIALPAMPHFDRLGSMAAFGEAIRSGEQPMTSGADNLKSLQLMYALVDSATMGVPVRIQG